MSCTSQRFSQSAIEISKIQKTFACLKLIAKSVGVGSAIFGRETAMACTVAVEEVIGEHYDRSVVYHWNILFIV